ncbi:AAA family ATPase [Haliangium sp.]|uniref:AAA family ATPase n=1 Tax=Haliangium sp. TaxID=2663208 RepID=UPI003D0D8C17
MLESLRIKNFRIFRSLEIERLGRVNLLVGKNNSGKSCLLEALRVYGERGDPALLDALVCERDEDLDALLELGPGLNVAPPDEDVQQVLRDPVRNLFHGYQFPSDLRERIEIGPCTAGPKLSIGLRVVVWNRDEEMPQRKVLSVESMDAIPDGAGLEVESSFSSEGGQQSARRVPDVRSRMRRSAYRARASYRGHAPYRERRPLLEAEQAFEVRCVPTTQMDDSEVERLWDRIVVRPALREHVVSALRLIDERIQEIVMLRSERPSAVPVLLYDDESRLPLKGLGDGAAHLFQIVLATAVDKGGMVLLDEFENGIHWSVLPRLWKLVFDLALDLDLQVFATTHSWDCVRAFMDTAQTHEAEAMLFRLGRSVRSSRRGEIVVRSYDKQSLELATQAGLEVR